ncbi:conserved hypothetical protein [Tenacibaculum maritimum]|uniref:hypothetical protein n=1 Tax=Tenacibaculum maritimum TaxID=107401 RepID=UPI0012E4F9E6|nr:hypothetical protein [Tenacibaculum maritimum]CAA0169888.1 conserved hypothetical protein [Tenacibaculum maritimum]CAA0214151.1 conserved hypothetical protein [Tenacibaculum maritimum]CAA0233234.1 conserved hypothetical protein [Tenacibaculum maritimum]
MKCLLKLALLFVITQNCKSQSDFNLATLTLRPPKKTTYLQTTYLNMKEPYYMIDFSAAACLFEISVNDQPILTMNLEGQTATKIPINNAIASSGKQEVSIKMLPLSGQLKLSPKAEFSYHIQLYDTSNGFELKKQFDGGFESKKIEENTIPIITDNSFFNAEVPYQMKDLWKHGKRIKDVKDYKTKVINAYKELINIIKNKKFDLLEKKLANREHNMKVSMYLSENESKNRISSLVNDLKNGYDYILFDPQTAIPIVTAYGYKIALKKINGDPALGFGNKEKNEQLMLDIVFYFNKKTNTFEII